MDRDLSSLQIPVVHVNTTRTSSEQTSRQLVDAAARFGFVFVSGHGLDFDAAKIDEIFALVRSRLGDRAFTFSRKSILHLNAQIVPTILPIKPRRESAMCHSI